ncbi:MAG: hypothetical protein VKL39_12010 [Leptolyngbyaceae bacterium]|nr:hypothetical protein [Leptolyngbyaceae bacterium]
MENFGYLEMAIAQENDTQAASTRTTKQNRRPSSRQTPSPQTSNQCQPDDFQIVSCWGMF